MSKKIFSVTVGIPVYNEENTIETILKLVVSQKQTNYRLDKILIVSDGSSDHTIERIERFAKKNKSVRLIKNTKRMGKATRLNQIFALNKSEILVLFDADIIFTDQNLINKMVSNFKDKSVGLVSANNHPIKPQEFVGRLWFAAEELWYEIRKDYQKGSNLFNNSGCSIAMEKNFSKTINLPKETIADQHFVYINSIIQNKKFIFDQSAYVYYVPPLTLQDLKNQYTRSLGEEDFLHSQFGEKYDALYLIPFKDKFVPYLKAFLKDPFFVISATFVLFLLNLILVNEDKVTKSGLWESTTSTKKGLSVDI